MNKTVQQSKLSGSRLFVTMVIGPKIFRCQFYVDNYATDQYQSNGFFVIARVNENADVFN